jgi:hypothetical protein
LEYVFALGWKFVCTDMESATSSDTHERRPLGSYAFNELFVGSLVDTTTGRRDATLALAFTFALGKFIDKDVDVCIRCPCGYCNGTADAIACVSLVASGRSSPVIVLEWDTH